MKAPDKIYIRDFGNTLGQDWTHHKGKKKTDVDVEYIRKDALLEFAEERRGKSITVGEHYAFGQIIDKINSL